MLIGIVGHPSCGKSSVAEILEGMGYRLQAFADPLKESLAVALRIPVDVFYDPKKKNIPLPEVYGKSPRELMQKIATEGYRDLVHADVWVDVWKRSIEDARKEGIQDIVVDDVRFPNELKALKEMGGLLVAIDRPGVENTMNHLSELHVNNLIVMADFRLSNAEGPSELVDKVNHLPSMLRSVTKMRE